MKRLDFSGTSQVNFLNSMTSFTMRALLLFLAAALLLLAVFAGAATQHDRADAKRGALLYHGKETLKARLSGHGDVLPAQMGRCANCHSPAKSERTAETFAPILTRDWLLQSRPRHGGPAYAYTQESFCNTVRTGIDPDYIILSRVMPRFEISQDQCQALWAYLTETKEYEK